MMRALSVVMKLLVVRLAVSSTRFLCSIKVSEAITLDMPLEEDVIGKINIMLYSFISSVLEYVLD